MLQISSVGDGQECICARRLPASAAGIGIPSAGAGLEGQSVSNKILTIGGRQPNCRYDQLVVFCRACTLLHPHTKR
jgi:hypothetical protein